MQTGHSLLDVTDRDKTCAGVLEYDGGTSFRTECVERSGAAHEWYLVVVVGQDKAEGMEVRAGGRYGQCCVHRVECFVLCQSVPCRVPALWGGQCTWCSDRRGLQQLRRHEACLPR